jgi:ATP-dependent helicase/nuclease subunit B
MAQAAKNVFTIAPDAPFLDTLAREIWHRAGGDSLALSRYLILLPTRRSTFHLGAAFARIAGSKPTLLPRMRPLGDIDEEEIILSDSGIATDLPPAIAPMKRLMLLTQQVMRRDPSLSWEQAALAADALARFLDQAQIEQCDMSLLPRLVQGRELAEHWQQTVEFLDIVTHHWPAILEAEGSMDPAARRNALLKAQADLWQRQQPDYPVIAAGSTGSIKATADLLDTIAALPQSAVILPGLDTVMDNHSWDAVDDTHPQHSMKRLLEKMGIPREGVHEWGEPHSATPRVRLISEAMRPAAVTEGWHELRGKLDLAATTGLSRVVCDHPQEEAQVIALRLRALLEEKDKSAALVTADRKLAQRVVSLLRRWAVDVDDSGGAPLALLPVGAYLNLVLAAASPQAGAVDLLALLKHPFAACGMEPAACREKARAAEIALRRLEDENMNWARQCIGPLTQNWRRALPLSDHVDAHVAAAEAAARTPHESGQARLWRGDVGDAVTEWFDEWRDGAVGFPPLTGRDYAALFATLSESKTMRCARATHPRLSILGPLEARLISADLVIMGGMNEGSWPPDPGFDPWMSRPMRHDFKLPLPEFRIGLSAHDFATIACAPEVMLTRAARSGGTPSMPSRFLLQLDAVLRATGLSGNDGDALKPAEPWRVWAQALDTPEEIEPCGAPQPRPPLDLRPNRLSVTDIGTWRRNPYAIYAKYVLGLRKLDELDAPLDASDKGNVIHAALEAFVRDWPTALPADAEYKLLDIGRALFTRDANMKQDGDPRVQAFWWASFVGIARWFVAHERKRRATGIMPIQPEVRGTIRIDGLTLRGRADRIDRQADGGLVIVDYKTGSVPKTKEVEKGIEPQLALLALIATRGGFADIPAADSATLEYWALKGGRGGCKIEPYADGIAAMIKQAEQGLKNLIAAYADPTTPYLAVPKPRLAPRYDDYAHLARLTEWGRVAEDVA